MYLVQYEKYRNKVLMFTAIFRLHPQHTDYINLPKSAFFIQASIPPGLVQSIAAVENRLWHPAELVRELMKTFTSRLALFLNVKVLARITAAS